MKNFIKRYFWLGLIVLLFLSTRFFKIDSVPGSVYWDEASIGYNAYSISHDLKDEWGDTLPLHFRAFGEFKLPVYIYSVAILTSLFGLSEFTLRLPSVLFTLGSVIAVYFLASRITKNKTVGLLSSFLFSISPWMLIFSRAAYEVSAGLFFFLGYAYFLIFNDRKKLNILLSLLFAILSFYSYNSFRILIPIFFLIWLAKTYLIDKEKIKKPIFGLLALTIFGLALIPTIRLYKYDSGVVRLTTVGIKNPGTFVTNYLSHFNYNFLFIDGDHNDRSQVPGWGQLYLIELPFIILGLISMFKNRKGNLWVTLVFLIISAIPASLTRESPHALRAIMFAPTFAIISSLGITKFVEYVKFKKIKKYLMPTILVVYLVFFSSYYLDFINNYNKKAQDSWQYQYKDLFLNMKNVDDGNKIIISDEFAQPYIFALFYLKYPPERFRSSVKYNTLDKWGFSTVESFGNFKFKKL